MNEHPHPHIGLSDVANDGKHHISTEKGHGVMNEMTANARRATEKEQKMSLIQGVKLYPKAVAWSMLISTCIVMEGKCSAGVELTSRI